MAMFSRRSIGHGSIALGLTIAAGVCAGCTDEHGERGVDGITVNPGIEPKVWSGWSGGGDPPLSCDVGRLVQGVECQGPYCSGVRIDCSPLTGLTFNISSSWSSLFTDEATNYRVCSRNEWMVGLMCSGINCGAMGIYCQEVMGVVPVGCAWSGFYTQVEGPFQAPPGRFLRGVACVGYQCAALAFYHCGML